MIDGLLNFMLGPLRGISHFYFQNQVVFNLIIVGLASGKLLFGKKKRTVNSES